MVLLREASEKRLLLRLWSSMPSAIKARAIITLCAMLLAGVVEFAFLVTVRALLSVITGIDVASESYAISSFAICAAFVAFSRLAAFTLSDRLAIEYSAFTSVAIFKRAMRRSYLDHSATRSAELFSALANNQRLLNSTLTPLLDAAVSAVIAAILMLYLLWLAPIIVLPILIFSLAFYTTSGFATGDHLLKGSRSLHQLGVQRLQLAHAAQQGFRDLILGQAIDHTIEAFVALEGEYRDRQIRTRLTAIFPRHVIELLMIAFLIWFVLYGTDAPGGIMSHIPLLGVVTLGIQRLLPLWSTLYAGWGNFQSNTAFLAESLDALSDSTPYSVLEVQPVPFVDQIVFNDVKLSYTGRDYVLNGVNLTIARGARVGIIGASGTGKSSLLDLLLGLVGPTEGDIFVDGLPLNCDERRRGWQSQIASVSQSSYLPDTSLRTAIVGHSGHIDPDRFASAIKGASLESCVASLPKGVQTRIGEAGTLMSDGEKQRVVIARALYRGAALLVLDELSSNLDEYTERTIVNTLAGSSRDLTIVIATHRTAPLAICDQVFLLERGRLRPAEVRA